MMKRLGISLLATVGLVSLAHAADILPTTKAPPAPPPNCFASFWSWLESSAAECPFTYAGFTAYATLDAGIGWESNGAGYNPNWNNGVQNIITKQNNHGPQWLWTPNGLQQSNIGIKMAEPLWSSGWSLIGTAEMGFNPLSGTIAWAQRGQIQDNGRPLLLQTAAADSSRTGQWDNAQAFLGVSNKLYGTLTAGRVYTLSLDGINSYDPMMGSYAFSPLGYSGSYAGFGDTEAARVNTAVKYRVDFLSNYRAAALVQWGGYDQGNGTSAMYQAQLGGDFHLPTSGVLSVDFIGSYAKDAVNIGTPTFVGSCSVLTKGPLAGETGCVNGGIPTGYNNTDVPVTLSNNTGFLALGKYAWHEWTFYGSYEYLRQQNPSDTYYDGFKTIGYYNVPGTDIAPNLKVTGTNWITYNAYNIPRIANVFWTGVKYSVPPNPWFSHVDLIAAFYWLGQNNYNFAVASNGVTAPAACTTVASNPTITNANTVYRLNSGKCAGSTDFLSFLIDWKPVKRVDVYLGVMESNVYGGLANGYQHTQQIAPTGGIRIKF